MPTPPADRPRLLPHAIPLQRDEGSVQFGLSSADALVLDGLIPAEVELINRLDGTRERAELIADDVGVRDELLLQVLADAGLLAASGDHSRRDTSDRVVLVHGIGRLADDIALQLSASERIHVVRGERVGSSEWGGRQVSLVVLVEHRAIAPDARREVEAIGAPILPVLHDGPHGVVGPLVLPGRSACLGCLDRTRADRDPAWGSLLRQATTWSVRPDLALTAPDRGLAGLLTATAVMVAGCAAQDRCPAGISLEVSLPWPRHVQRRWEPHPACGCVSEEAPSSATMGA